MSTIFLILFSFCSLFKRVYSITSIPSSLPALTPDPVNITINTEFPSTLLTSLTSNSYLRIDLKPNVPYGIRDDTPLRIKDSLNFFYQAYEYKYDRLNDEILIFNIKNHLPLKFELQNIFYSGPDQYYVDLDKHVPMYSFLNLTFLVLDNINSNVSIWNKLLKIPFSTENAKYHWYLNYGLNISDTTLPYYEFGVSTCQANFMYDTLDEPNNFITEPLNVPPNTHYNITFRIPIPKYRTFTKEGFIRFVPYTAMKGVYQDIFGFFTYDMVIVQQEYDIFAVNKKKMIDKYESCWAACEKFNTFSEHTYIQATIGNKTKTIYDFESHKETALDIEYFDYITQEFLAAFPNFFVKGLFPEYTFYFLKIFDEPVTYRQEFVDIKICNLFSISDPNSLGHLGFTLFGGYENYRFRNAATLFFENSLSSAGSYYMQHEHLYLMSKIYTGIKRYPDILNVKLEEVGDMRINEMRNLTLIFNTSILASDWSRFRVVFPESFNVSKLKAQLILNPDNHFDPPYPLNFTYNSTRNSLQFDLRFVYYLNWDERKNPASQTPFNYNFSQFSIQLLNFQNPDRITSPIPIPNNCSFSHCNFSNSSSSTVTLIWMPNYWYLWWTEGMYNSFYYMTKRFTTYDSSYWDLVTFANKVRDYDDFQVLEYVAGEVDIEVIKTRIGGIKVRSSNDIIGERGKWLVEFWSETQLSLDVAIRIWGLNVTAETTVHGFLNTYDGNIRQNEDGSIDIFEIFKQNHQKNFSFILTNVINANLTSPLPLAFFNRISMQLIAEISYSDYYFENTFITEKGTLLLQPPTINITPSSLFASIELNFITIHALEYLTELSIKLFFPEFFEFDHPKSAIALFLNNSAINSNLITITSNAISFKYRIPPNPVPRNTSFTLLIQGIYGYLTSRLHNNLNISIFHNNRAISTSLPLPPPPVSSFPPSSYIIPFNLSNPAFGEKSNLSFYLPCSVLLPSETLFFNFSAKWRAVSQAAVFYSVENADFEIKVEPYGLAGEYSFHLEQKRFFFDQIKIQVQAVIPYREGDEEKEEGREEEEGRKEEGRSFFVAGLYNLQPNLMNEVRTVNNSEGGWSGDYNYSVVTKSEMDEGFGLEVRLEKAFGLNCEGAKVVIDDRYEIGGTCERREEGIEEIFWFSNFNFIGLPETILTSTQYAERVLIPASEITLVFGNITNPINKTTKEEIGFIMQVMQNSSLPLQKSSSLLSYEISCPLSCESCNKDHCFECTGGSYMFLGSCLDVCPFGWYPDTRNCTECKVDNCLECELGGCRICMEGYEKDGSGCKQIQNVTMGNGNESNSTNGSLTNGSNVTDETNMTNTTSNNNTNETANNMSESNSTSNVSVVTNDTHSCYLSEGIIINCTLITNETNITNTTGSNNDSNSSNNNTNETANNMSESNSTSNVSVVTNDTHSCYLSEGIIINCTLITNETNITNTTGSNNDSNSSNNNTNETANNISEFNSSSNVSVVTVVTNDTYSCYLSDGIIINCTMITNETNFTNTTGNNNETNTSTLNDTSNNTENASNNSENASTSNNTTTNNNSNATNDNNSTNNTESQNVSNTTEVFSNNNTNQTENESNLTSNTSVVTNDTHNCYLSEGIIINCTLTTNETNITNTTGNTNNSSVNENSTNETNSSTNATSNTSECTNSSGVNSNSTNENASSIITNTTNISNNSNSTDPNTTANNTNTNASETNTTSTNANNSNVNNYSNSTNNTETQNSSNRTDSSNASNDSTLQPSKNESSQNNTNSSQENKTEEKNNSTTNDSSLNGTNSSILDSSHKSNMTVKAASIIFVNTTADNQLFLTYYVVLTSIIVLIFKLIRKENEAIHVLESLLIFWTLIDPLTTLLFLIKSLLLNYHLILIPCILLLLSFYFFHIICSIRIAKLIRIETCFLKKSTSFSIYLHFTKLWNYRLFLLPLTNLINNLGFSRRSRENLVLHFKEDFKKQIALNTLNILMGIVFIIIFSEEDPLPLYFAEFIAYHFLLSIAQFMFVKQRRIEKFEGSTLALGASTLGPLKESEITFVTGASIPGSPKSPMSPGSPLIKGKIRCEGGFLMDHVLKVEEEKEEEGTKRDNEPKKGEEAVKEGGTEQNIIEIEETTKIEEVINKRDDEIREEEEVKREDNVKNNEDEERRRREEEGRRRSVPKKISFVDTRIERKIVETEGDFVLSMSDIEMNIH